MHKRRKFYGRGPLVLMAAALLGGGVPAHAKALYPAPAVAPAGTVTGPALGLSVPAQGPAGARLLPPAGPCRERPQQLVAQTPAETQEAERLQQRRLQEQRQRQKIQPKEMPRGVQPERPQECLEKSAPTSREVPAKSGTRKFGAQPIRSKDSGEGE